MSEDYDSDDIIMLAIQTEPIYHEKVKTRKAHIEYIVFITQIESVLKFQHLPALHITNDFRYMPLCTPIAGVWQKVIQLPIKMRL